jgi:RNA-directed DNA polymerase
MPTMANSAKDQTRQLQRALYRAAKRSATRRFHALYDKVHRWDILERAWQQVRSNGGAAGVDRESLRAIEQYGVERVLLELQDQLRNGNYRPKPVRRVYIPKPGKTEKRSLGIPPIRDRIIQTATKIVVEPIFEADFIDHSYGFRPKRSAHDAENCIRQLTNKGRHWVVDADIMGYFDNIDQTKLMTMIEQRVSDRRILKLIRSWLRAGVMEEGNIRKSTTGTPQGGSISPLLANIYLHHLDRKWQKKHKRLGEMVRYADDLVILCTTAQAAEDALRQLTNLLTDLGLQVNPDKTHIRCLFKGQEGFDFLGFHHRMKESWRWKGRYYLQTWPSNKAMKAICQKIKTIIGTRDLTFRRPQEVAQKLNPILRGWGNYFHKGNSSRKLDQIDNYVIQQLQLYLSEKHHLSGRNRWRWPRTWIYKELRVYCLCGTTKWHTSVNAHG